MLDVSLTSRVLFLSYRSHLWGRPGLVHLASLAFMFIYNVSMVLLVAKETKCGVLKINYVQVLYFPFRICPVLSHSSPLKVSNILLTKWWGGLQSKRSKFNLCEKLGNDRKKRAPAFENFLTSAVPVERHTVSVFTGSNLQHAPLNSTCPA